MQLKDYLEKNKVEAYRLFRDGDIAVDVYKDNAVVHVFGKMPDKTKLESKLHGMNIKAIYYKDRRGRGAGEALKAEHKKITVIEYGHKFEINLSDYLDTGLFLDHRESRKWIESRSKNKVVLNTFAYTGSFTIYAACGGAAKTYTVDLSKTYCDWVKRNLALNNLPEEKNWVYKMDALEFFTYAKRKKLIFDIIIIDPPTFSKNKGKNFSVERDHPALINAALEVLSADGFILFSNNCKTFRLNKSKINSRHIQVFKKIPPDFDGVFSHHCFLISRAPV